ncbi:MAG: sulfurtransferase [Anaerolineales bacterium]
MAFESIISCEEASVHLQEPSWVFVDCRASLADKSQGYADYLQSHIAGAVYASLDGDLSGKVIPGQTGRHPLPEKQDLIDTFSRLGIANHSQVVVYDNQAGQMAAARLWWLLRWAGHASVAVLDGGLQCWQKAGLPVQSGLEQNKKSSFLASFDDSLLASSDDVLEKISASGFVIVDSRATDRYHGQNETIDPVAGHIPSAISYPFGNNISADGRLKPSGELKEQFKEIENFRPEHTIFYCGSGVTAAQNILSYAYTYPGKRMPRLYVGSWSEWITDKSRPIA